MDFYEIIEKDTRNNNKKTVRPNFISKRNKDIIIKNGEFYAVWDERNNIWSNSVYDLIDLVDESVVEECKKLRNTNIGITYTPELMVNNTRLLDEFTKWCKLQSNNYKPMNCKVKFNNDKIHKTDYSTFKLPYAIEEGPSPAYDELMSTLYSQSELDKIEWAIGSIIVGDSKTIQKAIALYGGPGTGKSTVLKIITKLFTADRMNKYVGSISTKNLVRQNDNFSAAPLKEYKLILIDDDANLTRVDDNATLNTIISHEPTRANSKYGKDETIEAPVGMLFLATNSYIGMTDAKSGLKRRFIVVEPTGKLIEQKKYDKLMREIHNELGQIAYRCKEKYMQMGIGAYNDYVPNMMYEYSNSIYSWLSDTWEFEISKMYPEGIPSMAAWELFKKYCEDSRLKCGTRSEFKIDMEEYFDVFENIRIDGHKYRQVYANFKEYKFKDNPIKFEKRSDWLDFKDSSSLLNDALKDCTAQYEIKDNYGHERPQYAWCNVKTTLKDIITTKAHYVITPGNMVILDFDGKNESGEKDKDINIEAARNFPETYGEFSKSGAGIHLHYYYDGDVSKLAKEIDVNGVTVEIKKQATGFKLRRKLSKCNNVPIAHLMEGDLPLEEKKRKKSNMVHEEVFRDNADLERSIIKCMTHEIGIPHTRTEINFIKKILDDAYESGKPYDVRNMKASVIAFAGDATRQSAECLKIVNKEMHFCSKDFEEEDFVEPNSQEYEEAPIAFFDVEVLPNLFVICWKLAGKDQQINKLINPTPTEVYKLFCINKYRWVGYNNRKYDNHIVKAWANGGRTNYDLYALSKRIIVYKDKEAYLPDAWNLSYTDILDYTREKKKLKKWEIDLGIHHQELGLAWDEPVSEELWDTVADYCCNDVVATEEVWNATQDDFLARKILAEIAGGTPNTPTNKLSAKFIFEGNKEPQSAFNYRFMGEPQEGQTINNGGWDDGITYFQDDGKPIFKGYEFYRGISSYLDVEEVGEGGYVYAEIGNNKSKSKEAGGMYGRTITLDVASMHPSSAIAENLFGDYYTNRFKEILDLRLAIKHKEYDKAKKMFDGKLAQYLDDPEKSEALASALKLIINSVYGLTAANFVNEFRDQRNIDNIVAKRGALFMINLRNLVQQKGYTVVHIKTDSIKIENPDDEIISFVVDYGKAFGYNFEVEHIFEKICLVNNAVYIAKLAEDDPDWIKTCKKAKAEGKPKPTRWTATGDQFKNPYVFKTLFSGEDIEFKDLCETKTVNVGEIYLDFNESLEDVSEYEECIATRIDEANGKKLTKKKQALLEQYANLSDDKLNEMISLGHEYRFVGQVGSFCPVNPNTGGAIMYRRNNDKNFAVEGTKGWLWKEAEVIKDTDMQNIIDYRYFDKLVEDAKDKIAQYGDFEQFVS